MRSIIIILALLLLTVGAKAQRVGPDKLYIEPFIVIDPGVHTLNVRRLDIDKNERFLVTGSPDKTVRIWSIQDGQLLRTIRVPAGPDNTGMVLAVAISPDGATIAAGGITTPDDGENIYLFERNTGRMIARIPNLPGTITNLAFSPDGSHLAATFGTGGIMLFENQSWQQVAADNNYRGPANGLSFAPDGRIATTSFDGNVRLYGARLDGLQTIVAPEKYTRPGGIAFSPNGNQLAVGYENQTRVSVLDGHSLHKLFDPDFRQVPLFFDGSNLSTVAWSAYGQTLLAAGSWMPAGLNLVPVRSWNNGGRGSPTDHPVSTASIVALRTLGDGRVAVGTTAPNLLIADKSFSTIWQTKPQTADFRGELDRLRVSSDGSRIQFDFGPLTNSPARLDLRQRTLNSNVPPDDTLAVARTEGLNIGALYLNYPHKAMLGHKTLNLSDGDISRSVAVSPDGESFVLGTNRCLCRFDMAGNLLWTKVVPASAWAVNITRDGRLVVVAYGDGTIRWHRLKDGAEILALFPHPDGTRWVVWTPLGHYVASPGGEDLIRWQINRGVDQAPEVYTASRFRRQFYRPDVIERVLDELDPANALNAADRATGRQAAAAPLTKETPPRVAIIDPADDTFVDKPELSVAYTVQDQPGTKIRRVRLLVNARVAAEVTSLEVPLNGRFVGELKIAPQADDSTLTILAESDKGWSDADTIRISRPAATPDSYKPDLYVLSVGVGTFRDNAKLHLDYAAADAKDFAERLRRQEGGLYRRVQLDTLTDADATGRGIREGFEWLEREMTARDVAVVFLSTHGAPDGRGNLLLLPTDVDTHDQIELRHSSITFAEMQDTLARLAERGRTLVFLDACHSGNIIPGTSAIETPDVDKAALELASAESGVIVFSSSTGTQVSVELPRYGHGAFTEALLEAFDTQSATREPPYLYVEDFDRWLRKRVKDLTNGAQTPQTTVPYKRLTNPRVFLVRSQ